MKINVSPTGLNLLTRLALLCGSLFFCTGALTGWGAPMNGYESVFTQPDGTEITLKFYGDEFYARTETTDGYTVVFDPVTKSYDYAKLSQDKKKLVAAG